MTPQMAQLAGFIWDSRSDVWAAGAPDESSLTGYSYGWGSTAEHAIDDLTAYLGYDPFTKGA